MEKNNLDLNIVTYSVVLRGMCHAGKLNDALELFSCLPAKVLKPDVYTYTIMIQGLCGEGLLIDAEEMLMNMEEHDCLPDSCTYNVFIQGLLRRNHPRITTKKCCSEVNKIFPDYERQRFCSRC
ncbi:hypothetical protein S83_052756 [Arachis hypogaea]